MVLVVYGLTVRTIPSRANIAGYSSYLYCSHRPTESPMLAFGCPILARRRALRSICSVSPNSLIRFLSFCMVLVVSVGLWLGLD